MQEIFEKRQNVDYNLRFRTDFALPGVNTTCFDLHLLNVFLRKFGMLFQMRSKTP